MTKATVLSIFSVSGISRPGQVLVLRSPSRLGGSVFRAVGRCFLLGMAMISLMRPNVCLAADSGTRATGTIEGRVSNAGGGNYLKNALVKLGSTKVETATNDIGEYWLSNVPPGETQIAVTFAGMATETVTVTVEAGQVLHRDFSLHLAGSDVVQLDKFVVTLKDRDLSGQAVADQERLTAPNLKNVISLDEFGDMGEGNVGEYLKYIPGVSLGYNPRDPQFASIRGMPASGTIMQLDGQEVANAQNATRSIALNVMATGNIDRIEVSKVPTPDMPANAVGGMINVITKNGFSSSKPRLSYNVFMTASGTWGGGLDTVDYSLHSKPALDPKSAGAPDRPAYNLSYIVPLNKKLAFTFALSESNRPSNLQYLFAQWDQVKGINTYTRAEDVGFNQKRDLGAMSVEWKISKLDFLKAGFQVTHSLDLVRVEMVNALTGAGAIGDANFSQGAATAVGSAQQVFSWVDRYQSLKNGNLTYRHAGSTWEVTAAATWSQAGTKTRDTADGFFNSVAATIPSLIMHYDGIDSFGTKKVANVTATTANGTAVNINNGNNYPIASAASLGPLDNLATIKHADLNVRRTFGLSVPFAVKVGVAVSQTESDATGGAYSMAFTPPGGAAAQLASNYDLISTEYSAAHSFDGANGQPVNVSWLSPYKLNNLYLAHPEYFVFGTAQQGAQYISQVNTAKKLRETIPAAYIRADIKFFNDRLSLTGGVRFEQTQDDGLGPLQNINAGFQKDASGKNLVSPTGAFIPISTNVLTQDQLIYTKYGTHQEKSYEGFYPSLNTSFALRPNLIVRAAYAKTIGRPDLSLILPGTTVTDSATARNTITVVNTALKPWTANNYDLALEMYNQHGATASINGYRKDLTDFFGKSTTPATAADLAAVGLPSNDPANYDVVTMQNFGAATIQGLEFSYRQLLTPYLPSWAKGLEVYVNVSTQTLSGPNAGSFSTFSPHESSWGISYANSKFIAKVNFQHSGWIRNSVAAASATVPPNAYNVTAPQTRLDVSAEYRFNKYLSLYGSVRNLGNAPKRTGINGPGIPQYTVLSYYQYTGAQVTLGIKGEF